MRAIVREEFLAHERRLCLYVVLIMTMNIVVTVMLNYARQQLEVMYNIRTDPLD